MCVKFKDEYLEVDGKRCLYSDILKCSIQNEDANFKGRQNHLLIPYLVEPHLWLVQ